MLKSSLFENTTSELAQKGRVRKSLSDLSWFSHHTMMPSLLCLKMDYICRTPIGKVCDVWMGLHDKYMDGNNCLVFSTQCLYNIISIKSFFISFWMLPRCSLYTATAVHNELDMSNGCFCVALLWLIMSWNPVQPRFFSYLPRQRKLTGWMTHSNLGLSS